jgi:hypothetical protein
LGVHALGHHTEIGNLTKLEELGLRHVASNLRGSAAWVINSVQPEA